MAFDPLDIEKTLKSDKQGGSYTLTAGHTFGSMERLFRTNGDSLKPKHIP